MLSVMAAAWRLPELLAFHLIICKEMPVATRVARLKPKVPVTTCPVVDKRISKWAVGIRKRELDGIAALFANRMGNRIPGPKVVEPMDDIALCDAVDPKVDSGLIGRRCADVLHVEFDEPVLQDPGALQVIGSRPSAHGPDHLPRAHQVLEQAVHRGDGGTLGVRVARIERRHDKHELEGTAHRRS
jgi:hypothetical protein